MFSIYLSEVTRGELKWYYKSSMNAPFPELYVEFISKQQCT